MKLPRRPFLHLAAGAAALPTVSRMARAQAYPSRPVTMVVGFAAGGSADIIARILAERMRNSLGQPIVVENVAGASGSIAAGRVVRAAADGYTLSIGSLGTHVLNGALYTLQYDLMRDLEPVSLLVTQPQLILVKKSIPATDLKELIAWLKTNPDKASQGTSGGGSLPHVAGVLFQNMTGTRFQLVPYRGMAPAMQDLVAGQIDMAINVPSDSLPHIRAGSIKAYAVADKSRLAVAPDIPTVDEAGLPGFYMGNWYGLWVPSGTPKSVIAKINSAVVESLADSSVRSRLADTAQEIYPRDHQTPEALGALQNAEIEKWWPIIKAANIRPD
jgi:tripartite-type tricarboxylate transporter receptor subunit TctC